MNGEYEVKDECYECLMTLQDVALLLTKADCSSSDFFSLIGILMRQALFSVKTV